MVLKNIFNFEEQERKGMRERIESWDKLNFIKKKIVKDYSKNRTLKVIKNHLQPVKTKKQLTEKWHGILIV